AGRDSVTRLNAGNGAIESRISGTDALGFIVGDDRQIGSLNGQVRSGADYRRATTGNHDIVSVRRSGRNGDLGLAGGVRRERRPGYVGAVFAPLIGKSGSGGSDGEGGV